MGARIDPDAQDRLRASGQGLADALREAMATLPTRERTAETLARRYGIEGVVARRVVRAAACDDGLIAITRLPAAKHLHRLADALDRPDLSERLHAAVRAHGQLLADLGVGPVALKRLIRGATPEAEG